MARVITFSTVFPSYHPKAGQPTRFVEMFWESIYLDNSGWLGEGHKEILKDFDLGLHNVYPAKNHTIRSGNRWKRGDYFSPRIWSGKPYKSKQVIIAPDIVIEKVWDIEIWKEGIYTNAGIPEGKGQYRLVSLADLAKNDGLSIQDLIDWFNVKEGKPFRGQIISWNENIEY